MYVCPINYSQRVLHVGQEKKGVNNLLFNGFEFVVIKHGAYLLTEIRGRTELIYDPLKKSVRPFYCFIVISELVNHSTCGKPAHCSNGIESSQNCTGWAGEI